MKKALTHKQFVAAVDGPKMTARMERLIRMGAKGRKLPRNQYLLEALECHRLFWPAVQTIKAAQKEVAA